jgi:cystathionine beta-synthase
VGLALAAAIKGYRTIFVMPDKMSNEKIRTLQAFGASVVITPTDVPPEDPRSYYNVARRLAEETPNACYVNQYVNPANPHAHYRTTGPEIWDQMGGRLDVLVAGLGTGGTISGCGKFLKERDPGITVVGVDPQGSMYYDYIKHGEIVEPRPYQIEGIGEDFLPETIDFAVIDDVVRVFDREAFQMTRRLLTEEGLFAGISSGAAVAGALRYAESLSVPKELLVILPDSGNRYLSKVFDDDWMRAAGFLAEAGLPLDGAVRALEERGHLVGRGDELVTGDTVLDGGHGHAELESAGDVPR